MKSNNANFNDKFYVAKLALLNILRTANNSTRPGGCLSTEGLFAQDALDQIQILEKNEKTNEGEQK
jgi:hypothetical protein